MDDICDSFVKTIDLVNALQTLYTSNNLLRCHEFVILWWFL